MTLARIRSFAAWLVLAFLLVGPDLIGNLSAYSNAIVLLISLPLLLIDADLRARLWRPASAFFVLAFVLLLLAMTLSAQQPSDIQYAGNFIFFLMFPIAVALLSVNAGPRASEIFGWLALAGAIGAVGAGVYEVSVLGVDRAIGFINLTNPFAMAGVMLGFLSLMGFFARKDGLRLVFLLGPICAGAVSVLTGTRAAVVMIAVLAIVFVLFWSATLERRHRVAVLVSGAIIGVVAIGAAFVFSDSLRALSAFKTLGVFIGQGQAIDFSTEIRLNLYYGGFRAFLESPVFGHGWWHHFEAARPYMTEAVQQNTVNWSHLHNDYVNFAALAGVMGLAAYFIYMIVPVWGAAVSTRDSQFLPRLYGAVVMATCYAVFGLFDTSFSMEVLLGFGPICAAALLGFCVDRPLRRG